MKQSISPTTKWGFIIFIAALLGFFAWKKPANDMRDCMCKHPSHGKDGCKGHTKVSDALVKCMFCAAYHKDA